MAGRRRLGSALDLSPEKLAFIHDKPAEAMVIAPPVLPHESTAVVKEQVAADQVQSDSVAYADSEPPKPRNPRRLRRGGSTHESHDRPSLLPELRAPLTTRLHPATADALRRATLEQRLMRLRPATQQEIVEEAVRGWLKQNDYLD